MILAAGEGTRLRPLTLDRPKPMLPVADRPVLEHTVDWLHYYGVSQIAINLHYLPEVIQRHFGNGAAFGVEITYSYEEVLLGSAGGVKRIADFLNETFVLVYGDVLTDLNLRELIAFHRSATVGPHLTMSLYHVSNPTECGIVRLGGLGRVLAFVEKPKEGEVFSDLANAGVLIIDPGILEHIPDGYFCDFGRDVFPWLLNRNVPMYGWLLPQQTYLIDVGSHENYKQAKRDWPTVRARVFLSEKRKV